MTPVPSRARSARAVAARINRQPGGSQPDLRIERAAFVLGIVLFVLALFALRIITDTRSRFANPGAPASLSLLERNDHAYEA